MAGQYILKAGDEVQFVMHTNLKSGELNAQRVRRTKEGPELPPTPGAPAAAAAAAASMPASLSCSPAAGACVGRWPLQLNGRLNCLPCFIAPAEPAPKPKAEPVPAVNPNRNRYSGNLSSGGYKQPKIAKGPGEPCLPLGFCRAGVLVCWCAGVLVC